MESLFARGLNDSKSESAFKTQSENHEIFHDINRKMTKVLTNYGIIKSFKEIKKFDRIEMGNDMNEMNKIMDGIKINFSFYNHIPFINEGVLLYYTSSKTSIYNHFIVKSVNLLERTMDIDMDIYKFEYGYFSKIVDVSCSIKQENEGDDCCTIKYDKASYNFEYIERFDNKNEFGINESEYLIYKLYRDSHFEKMKKISKGKLEGDENLIKLVSGFINSFLTINNYINLKNNESENKSEDINQIKHQSSDRLINLSDKTKKSKNDIVIINGIKIKKGVNSQIKISKGKVINRQTQVWDVIGHVRHYKNGKVVYIRPYKKGPGREKESEKPNRKIYKVKTNEK